MRADIHQYMRVGLIHFMAYPDTMQGTGPIEETVRAIVVDDYFDAIEITWIKEPQQRKRVRAMLEASHLSIAYGGQPRLLTTGMNINSLDGGARNLALQTLYEGIEEAYEMGAEGLPSSRASIPVTAWRTPMRPWWIPRKSYAPMRRRGAACALRWRCLTATSTSAR